MYEILSGGLDVPVEGDYIKSWDKRGDQPVAKKKIEEGSEFFKRLMERVKNSKLEDKIKKDVIFRINKAESQYVSETQDNYRGFKFDKILKQFIYDCFGNPERNKGKAKIIPEEWMNTRYMIDYSLKAKNETAKPETIIDAVKLLKDEQKIDEKTIESFKESDKENLKEEIMNRPRKDKKEQEKISKRPKTADRNWKETVLRRSSTENRKERIHELHKWARWLPDSAYQSYFGKPAFHAYGKNNTNPTVGGVVYGQYMLTHNVNPEHGQNNPKYQQVYNSAMNFGFRNGDRIPVLSRKGHENLEITPSVLKEMMQRNPIMPPRFLNPDSTDNYTDASDNEEEITKNEGKGSKIKSRIINLKENKNDKNIIQANKIYTPLEENNISKEINLGEENIEVSKHELDRDSFKVGSPIPNITSSNPTPEPGSLEYKRMLEKFIRNPEYVKMISQEGADLQNMFPFCYMHNSYGQQLPIHELNPKNYKYLPSKFVKRIPAAGKKTSKWDSLYDVILPEF